jgi:hypothetical protein
MDRYVAPIPSALPVVNPDVVQQRVDNFDGRAGRTTCWPRSAHPRGLITFVNL